MAEDSSGTQTAEGTVQGTESVVPEAKERQEKSHKEGELESGELHDSLDRQSTAVRLRGKCVHYRAHKSAEHIDTCTKRAYIYVLSQ